MRSASFRRQRVLTATVLLLGLGLLPTAAAGQQPVEVHLDPAQTAIGWTLNASLHTVHGTFKLKSGTITYDPATGNASGEVVVDATSG